MAKRSGRIHDVQHVLAHNIKRSRELLRISQEALAERAGLSKSHIAEIETSRKFPSADSLQAICDALNVRPAVLFADEPVEARERAVEIGLAAAIANRARDEVVERLDAAIESIRNL